MNEYGQDALRGGTLRMTSTLSEFGAVRRFVEDRLQALGASRDATLDVLLAVEEMVMNVIIHGYGDTPGPIEITILPQGDSLEVRVRDRARPFDPTLVPAPDTSLPLDLRAPGGLGIHLARHYMDSMSYRRTPEGENELIMVKRAALNRGAAT